MTKAQHQDTYKHNVHLRLTVMPPTYDISQNNCVMLCSTSKPDIFHTYCQCDFQFCPLHIQHTSSVLPFSLICVQAEGMVWCSWCFEQVLLEDFSSCLYNFKWGTLLLVLAFVKAISTMQLSRPFSRSWEWLCLVARRSQWCLQGPAAPHLQVGPEPPTSTESTRGQAQSQRVSKLGRLVWARHQAPSTWRWVRASARELIGSQGRTRCILQPAHRFPRGRGDIRGSLGRVRRPSSAKWAAHAHSHRFRPVWMRCLDRDSQ